jgi:DNA-binding transcriptional ArsR family regulator
MSSTVLHAIADPTRRKILQLLRERDMTAGELAAHFTSAKPTLSRHFAVLKEADLIQGEKVGTTITYRLNISVLEEALLALWDTFHSTTKEQAPGNGTSCKDHPAPHMGRSPHRADAADCVDRLDDDPGGTTGAHPLGLEWSAG